MKDYAVQHIKLDLIDPNPLNPQDRGSEGDIKTLLASIRDSGLYYPILVNKKLEDRFQIIEGHRRFQVFKVLSERNPDYASIPCLIISVGAEYLAKIFREINDTAKKLTGRQWLEVYALGGNPTDLPNRLRQACEGLGQLFDHVELEKIARRTGPSVHGLAKRLGNWLGYDVEDASQLRKLAAWLVNSGDSVNVRVAMSEGQTEKVRTAIEGSKRMNGAAFPDGVIVAYLRTPALAQAAQ